MTTAVDNPAERRRGGGNLRYLDSAPQACFGDSCAQSKWILKKNEVSKNENTISDRARNKARRSMQDSKKKKKSVNRKVRIVQF